MTEFDYMQHAMAEYDKLNHSELRVGVLDSSGSFLQMIATVNNNGCHIHAKNYPKLRIPVRLPNGRTGYVFKESVVIPARRFMEKTIMDYEQRWINYMETGAMRIASEPGVTADDVMNNLGRSVVAQMQKEMTDWKSPGNAPLTIQNKGRDDPLIDKGKLRASISYEIVEK